MKPFLHSENFLRDLMYLYSLSKTPYCVLRNYEKITTEYKNGDVDFIIKDRYLKFQKILIGILAAKYGLKVFFENKVTSFKFILLKQCQKENYFFILDYLKGISWWGNEIISSSEILRERKKFNFFFVPTEEYKSLSIWLYTFISRGKLKDRYKKGIIECAQKNGFQTLLSKIVGDKLAQKMVQNLAKGHFEQFNRDIWEVRIKVILKNLICRPLDFFRDFFFTLVFVCKRYLKPKGIWVGVLGPDGSGKTTVINFLKMRLNQTIFPQVYIFHWRPEVLPSLSKLLTGVDTGSSPNTMNNPHKAEPASFLSSVFRLFYYSIDFLIGYYIKIKKRLYEGNLVIFDRYFHDFMVDPRRSRIKLPNAISYVIAKLLPHPDIIIFLNAKPKTIIKRKDELSIDEIHRQLKEYKKICSKFSYCVEIHAEKSPESIAKEIEDLVIKKWKKKW